MKRTEIMDAVAVICMVIGFVVLSVAFGLMLFHVSNSGVLWGSGALMYSVGIFYILFSEESDPHGNK